MRKSNNYISFDRALTLLQRGWIFKQDLAQSEFKIMQGINSCDWFKLNKATAIEIKKQLPLLKTQIKIAL